MAAISVQSMSRSGLQASYTNVATSHTFTNDADMRTFAHVVNGTTAMTLTIVSPKTVDTLAVADRTVAIGASEEHFVGPFQQSVYGASTEIQFNNVTNGTVAIIKVPNS